MPWFNNEYYNPKTKKWETGKYKKRGHIHLWWITPLAFIILSLLLSIVLNYFYPNTLGWFIIW